MLILDEPFSGLDVAVREHLVQSLVEQTPECTVLIATHDLAEIEGFATHVAYLSNGKLKFAEEMETLAAGFREVEVSLDERSEMPAKLPESWLNVNQLRGVVRFTHAAYSPERCDSELRQYWRDIRDVEVRPLPLRSIFVTLASEHTKRK